MTDAVPTVISPPRDPAALAARAPRRRWLAYALVTTVFWGVWGAYTGLPTENGFPETLVYVVWALTMVPPALFVLRRNHWRLARDRGAVALGMAIGLLGAGGQMLLFHAVKSGPAFLIFPIISLSPVVTIAMSMLLLGERTGPLGMAGIVLALLALPLFDYTPGTVQGYGSWFAMSLVVLGAWGAQAYVIKRANRSMDEASIFFYMMLSALLSIPAALAMTDFSQPITLGWSGPGLAAVVQVLNAVGALTLVYAFAEGKAIVVSPLVNAGAPLLTAILSLALAGVVPGPYKIAAIVLSLTAAGLLALQPGDA